MMPALRRLLPALLSLTLLQVIFTMATLTVPVLAPVAAADLGVDAALLAVYSALIYFGASWGSLIGGGALGALAPSRGPLLVMSLALLAVAAGLLLPLGEGLVCFAVGAFLLGLGYGPATPASSQILARATPPRLYGSVFSLKQTGVPLGGAAAGALVPALVLAFGWRGALLAVAALCLASAGLTRLCMGVGSGVGRGTGGRGGAAKEKEEGLSSAAARATPALADGDPVVRGKSKRAELAATLRLVLGHRVLRLLCLASLTYAMMQVSLGAFLVVYLVAWLDYSLPLAGSVLAVSQLAGAGGRLGFGMLADGIGRSGPVLAGLGLIMGAAGLVVGLFTPAWPLWAVMTVAAVLGAAGLGWTGVFVAEIARLAPPGEVGRASGGTFFITYGGAVLGPPVFGLLVWLFDSYGIAFGGLGLAAIVSGVVILYADPR